MREQNWHSHVTLNQTQKSRRRVENIKKIKKKNSMPSAICKEKPTSDPLNLIRGLPHQRQGFKGFHIPDSAKHISKEGYRNSRKSFSKKFKILFSVEK